MLTILGLYKDGKLNNACYFMFSSKEPTVLKMAVYVTDAMINFSDINRVHGNIYNLIEVAISYIKEHMNWKVEFEGHSTSRIEVPEVPVDAIREIVVNAFAHANYRSITEHEITITPSFIEIYNPGEFPINYKPEDFAEHRIGSMPKNKKILDILYKSKDVEVQGSGIRKTLESCKKDNTKYDYYLNEFGFRFKFYRKNVAIGTINGTINGTLKYNETDNEIVKLLKEHPEYTKEQMVEIIGKGSRTIQRSLNKLKENGRLVRIGSKKNGYWEIVE